MQTDFKKIIKENRLLEVVSKVAEGMGVDANVIGGFVRDQIVYGSQKKDIDIVCLGNGIDLAKGCQKELPGSSLAVFRNFGTASLTFEDEELEFVGARRESYRRNSRNPIVENGTMEEDQNRRDFTINALAISLTGPSKGSLIDPFDGVKDLEMQTIKTPLDPLITFSDDPLRIMRAIRFASQFYFDIEPNTFEALGKMSERLKIVSQERITTELNKIILSPKPSYGFKLLHISGVLKVIFPEMQRLHGVKKINGMSHKDNFYHTLQVLDNVADVSDNLWLRWAAILHDIAKPATQRFDKKVGWTFHGHEDLGAKWVPEIFKRLKLPLSNQMKYVQKLVRLHLRPIALVNEKVTDSAVRRLLFEAGNEIDDLMTLCRADITSKNDRKVKKYLANFVDVEAKIQEVEQKDEIRNFQVPLTGKEIMTRYNLLPGRVIGDLKEELKNAILDGKIANSRGDAIEFVDKIAGKKGLTKVTE